MASNVPLNLDEPACSCRPIVAFVRSTPRSVAALKNKVPPTVEPFRLSSPATRERLRLRSPSTTAVFNMMRANLASCMPRLPPILAESSHIACWNCEPANVTDVRVRSRFNTTSPANSESLISRGRVNTASRTSTVVSKTAPRMRTPSRGTARPSPSGVRTVRRKPALSFRRGSAKRSSDFLPEPSVVPNRASKSAGRPAAT